MAASLPVESSIWWSLVLIISACRFISRGIARKGKYQADDVAIAVALCFYTTFIVTINLVARSESNLLPPGFDLSSLTPSDRKDRIYGSKLILVLENCQNATIWLTKVAILVLYLRLTTLRWQHNAIRVLLAVVVLLYFVMTSLYLGVWCRPFSQYWAIPPNSSQCNAATNHLITNATFNLLTDVIMLGITAPLFWRMHLPWRKKIPLVGVFSLGIFVVLAAILNKVYSFTQPFGTKWPFWYVRESSTALLVADLPFVWGLWRRICGFKTSVVDSESITRRATIIDAATGGGLGGSDESRRKHSNTHHNPMEFITAWPLHNDDSDEKEDGDLDCEFRRLGARHLSLSEFLREDGGASRDRDRRRSRGRGQTFHTTARGEEEKYDPIVMMTTTSAPPLPPPPPPPPSLGAADAVLLQHTPPGILVRRSGSGSPPPHEIRSQRSSSSSSSSSSTSSPRLPQPAPASSSLPSSMADSCLSTNSFV